jgi:hypothetical protein
MVKDNGSASGKDRSALRDENGCGPICIPGLHCASPWAIFVLLPPGEELREPKSLRVDEVGLGLQEGKFLENGKRFLRYWI